MRRLQSTTTGLMRNNSSTGPTVFLAKQSNVSHLQSFLPQNSPAIWFSQPTGIEPNFCSRQVLATLGLASCWKHVSNMARRISVGPLFATKQKFRANRLLRGKQSQYSPNYYSPSPAVSGTMPSACIYKSSMASCS